MNRNNYNREACMEYFHAYRECKAIWVSLSSVHVTRQDLMFTCSSSRGKETGLEGCMSRS